MLVNVLIAVAIVCIVVAVVMDEVSFARRERRSVPPSRERSLEEERDEWLRCLHVEYAAGDLSDEELESEAERYIKLYEELLAARPEDRAYLRAERSMPHVALFEPPRDPTRHSSS